MAWTLIGDRFAERRSSADRRRRARRRPGRRVGHGRRLLVVALLLALALLLVLVLVFLGLRAVDRVAELVRRRQQALLERGGDPAAVDRVDHGLVEGVGFVGRSADIARLERVRGPVGPVGGRLRRSGGDGRLGGGGRLLPAPAAGGEGERRKPDEECRWAGHARRGPELLGRERDD